MTTEYPSKSAEKLEQARKELRALLELPNKSPEQYRRIGELQYGIIPALERQP